MRPKDVYITDSNVKSNGTSTFTSMEILGKAG